MLLLMMLVTLVMTDTGDASSDTTCIAVTDVFFTNVTCLFGRNMSKLSFNVKFFYPDRNAEPEFPLACNTKRSGGLVCQKEIDVVFDETQEISDRVTFTRPSSITVLRGEYLCQAIPHVGGSLDYCTLTYRGSGSGVWERCGRELSGIPGKMTHSVLGQQQSRRACHSTSTTWDGEMGRRMKVTQNLVTRMNHEDHKEPSYKIEKKKPRKIGTDSCRCRRRETNMSWKRVLQNLTKRERKLTKRERKLTKLERKLRKQKVRVRIRTK
ncbi:uncharacterized protein LOC143291713 isoform X4 [Babylonia areolata]|uniref:uncharacterized protein LOC143291713 isoform X4 n=1 Tax=Babylonia areolata TaxID=304850 RepID=UPI003FD20430